MSESDEVKPRALQEDVGAPAARLRAQGLRPIEIWVPDVRAPGFGAEARRQARLVAASREEAEDQAWLDGLSDLFAGE